MANVYNDRAGESRAVGEIRPAAEARAAAEAQAGAEPSIAQLLSSLIGDAQTLVRREVDLARAEIMGEIARARQGAIWLGAGIGAAAIGGLFLLVALAEALAYYDVMARWLAYLLIGIVLAIGGAIALIVGIQRFQKVDPVPHETIDSVRKDISWLSEQAQSETTSRPHEPR